MKGKKGFKILLYIYKGNKIECDGVEGATCTCIDEGQKRVS